MRLGKYPEAKESLWRTENLYLAYQKENPEWNIDGELVRVYMNQSDTLELPKSYAF
ncbi:MAG: hypothetical protein LUH10_03950 [Tannerellaceae bacterium]|nr:hypothetical protein [Tannerellaceae bacterium]